MTDTDQSARESPEDLEDLEDIFPDRAQLEGVAEANVALIKNFIEAMADDRADSTLKHYASNLLSVAEVVHPTLLIEMSSEELDELNDWLADENYQRPTRHSYVTTLKLFFEWAAMDSLASELTTRIERDTDTINEARLTEPQVYDLIAAAGDDRYQALFEFLWLTGFRVSDCLDPETLTFGTYELASTTGKRVEVTIPYPHYDQHERADDDVVTLTDTEAQYFFAWYHAADYPSAAEIWLGDDDTPPSVDQARYHLRQAAARAGIEIDVTPQRLRQSRAIHLVYHGHVTDVSDLRRRFGWSDATQTAQQYWDRATSLAAQDTTNWQYCPTCTAALPLTINNCYRCGTAAPQSATQQEPTSDADADTLVAIHDELQELRETQEQQIELLKQLVTQFES